MPYLIQTSSFARMKMLLLLDPLTTDPKSAPFILRTPSGPNVIGPIVKEGMMCKHTVKVFKILHPDVEDGVIFREVDTKHGIYRATSLSQCFARPEQQAISLNPRSSQPSVGSICANLHDNELHPCVSQS